jgi:hypothetical protein
MKLGAFSVAVWCLASAASAQDTALQDRVMAAVNAAMAPALPFPKTDDAGALPATGNTEALWMVRPLQTGDRTIEVLANPLNEVNQLRANRAMAQIGANVEAAQRRAALQYDRAVAEAKRSGRSQEVDGVTLSDEGVAGARIDAESHLIVEVAFNQAEYRSEFMSGRVPYPSLELQKAIPAAAWAVVLPSNAFRDQTDIERFAEGETLVYLGRVERPVMKKRGDSDVYEVSAPAAVAEGALVASLVVRLRGNELLMADLLRKTNWNALLELMK